MYAARCGLYTKVGSPLSLPSSILLGIALSVTTPDWLLYLSRATENQASDMVRLQIFGKLDIIYINRMAGNCRPSACSRRARASSTTRNQHLQPPH